MTEATPKAVNDGLQNVITGAGTGADQNAYRRWAFGTAALLTDGDIDAAYRTNWMVRKGIDIPVEDMTSEWRSWQAKESNIEGVEAEEKRLLVRERVKRALWLAALRGGAAIVMGLPGDPAMPAPQTVGLKGLKYLHTVSRRELTLGDLDMDLNSENFGKPSWYTLNRTQTRIHPSRVIVFHGQPVPDEMGTLSEDAFWGDPKLFSVNDAVMDGATVQSGVARLINEAKTDVVNIPNLMSQVGTQEYEDQLMKRLRLVALSKSMYNTTILDGEEEWSQKQVSFAQLPETVRAFTEIVAGAFDIPLTRFLGTAASGLNATGEGDRRNYLAKVRTDQNIRVRPALDRIDTYLVPSALGSRPADVWWTFNPLEQSDPSQVATIEKTKAETFQIYANMGALPDTALAKVVQNSMTESGAFPGVEQALAEAEAEGEIAALADPDDVEDPSALTQTRPDEEQQDPPQRRAANDGILDRIRAIVGLKPSAPAVVKDSTPRTLYVSRTLLNADEVLRWAKGQGIPNLMKASDLHVTIAYSRAPVDWMAMGSDWSGDQDGKVRVPAGGPRVIEKMGGGGAVALLFDYDGFQWRHNRMKEAGASWDWPSYQPHLTLTWDIGDVDIATVEPYNGPLVFGPEVFAEVVEDWRGTKEKD